MDKPDMNLDKIASICRLEKRHNAKLYHQTKLLLELYRKVVWSVENSLYDLESTATDFGSQRIQDLLNYLDLDFEGEVDKGKIEDHLKSIAKSKDLVFLIDQAMMKLNDYPNGGELFSVMPSVNSTSAVTPSASITLLRMAESQAPSRPSAFSERHLVLNSPIRKAFSAAARSAMAAASWRSNSSRYCGST